MSQFFAEAEVLIRPNTTGFAAALVTKVNEEILAAQSAIKPMVVGAVVAPAGTAGAASEAAALTGANVGLAGASSKTADEIRKVGTETQKTTTRLGAGAKAANALEHNMGKLTQGAEATGLSLLNVRGATLAASKSFLAGAAIVVLAAKSIGAASDRTEQLNKSFEVFGQSADQVKAWAETTATSMGISETAALSASSTYGELFRTLDVGPKQAAALSESLVKLAGDLASFNNVSVDRALAAIQSGLVGQARPLRALGVFLTEARVKQEAFLETGKKSAASLTQQDKILARYSLILQDAAIASGDFQRTSGRLANQSRTLQANISNLAAEIGLVLTPAVTDIVGTLNDATGGVLDLIDGLKSLASIKIPDIPIHFIIDWGGQGGKGFSLGDLLRRSLFFAGTLRQELKQLNQQFVIRPQIDDRELQTSIKNVEAEIAKFGATPGRTAELTLLKQRLREVNRETVGLSGGYGELTAATRGVTTATEALNQEFNKLVHTSAQVSDEILRLQSQGAGPSALLSAQQAQLAADQAVLSAALAQPQGKGRSTAIRRARQAVIADRAEIKRLTQEIQSDAKAASDAIQRARDKADQAIQDAISGAQARIDVRKAIAEGTTQTLDDLNALKHERAVIHQLILTLVPRIKDEQLKAEVYAQLTLQEIQTNNAIKKLEAERKAARQAQRQAAIDAQQQHLETLISIAQTTPGTADDLRTLNAYKAFLEKRIKALQGIKKKTLEEKAQLDAYRLALAQTNQSIRELSKESQKGSTFAQQAFAFLQTQQGFVSNLLGNLIPGGLTGGLVGGGTPTIPANAAQQRISAGFEQPRGVNFTAGEAVRTRPVSQGQANTQITLLRDIRDLLRRINRGGEHPEAKHQRSVGSSAMDFHIQGTYGM